MGYKHGASASPTGPAPQGAEPLRVSGKAASPLRVCRWCREPEIVGFHQGKRKRYCGCSGYRSPIEVRRDAVLDKYGDDPTAYTPAVLAELAKDGLFDITASFCPAGKLSMAETKAREAAVRRA